MLIRFALLCFLLLTLSPVYGKEPVKKSPKTYYRHLSTGIDQLLKQLPKEAHVGISVLSLSSGAKLYEKNPEQLFIPADTAQLFTAGAALSTLGPNHRFTTSIFADAPIRAGILKGNLYLQGGADPTFTLHELEMLVRELRLLGLKQVEGNLVVDATLFDDLSEAPGSILDDQVTLAPPIPSALTINRNSIELWIEPGSTVSTPPKIFAFPKTSFVKIENLATTDDKAGTLRIHRSFTPSLNTVRIKGRVKLKSPLQSTSVALEKPSLYAASLFSALLKKGGITYAGTIEMTATPPTAHKLSSSLSPPLSLIVQTLLRDSDCLYANTLFKKLGQLYAMKEEARNLKSYQEDFSQIKGQGSWKTGSQALLHHLKAEANLNVTSAVLLDGSGFSRYNLISPRQMTDYLKWIYKDSSIAEDFIAALPHQRFPSQWLRAKGGSLSGVRSFTGFLKTKDGELLAVSIMIGGIPRSSEKEVSSLETKLCDLLLKASRAAENPT